MAVATGLAIAGGALGALGSASQAKAQKKAAQQAAEAAQFNPYGTDGGTLGRVSFRDNKFQAEMNPATQHLYNQLGGLMQGYFGGNTPTQGFQQFAMGLGNSGIPGLFGDSLAQSAALPQEAFNAQQSLFGGLSNLAGNLGTGLMGQAGQAGNNAASLMQQAQQVAGNAGFDPTQMVNDRLGLLREQAAPQEERALNSLQQRLFSQGRLGSTSGSRDFEAFGRGLGQADLARQVEAQNLGLAAQAQAQQYGLSQAGLLSGMAGQSLQQQLTQSQQGLGALGLAGDFGQQAYTGALGFNELGNTRAQQRLQSAMGLFGFGQDAYTQDFNQMLSSLQAQQTMENQLRNLIALGGNLGGAQAQAGATQAQALLTNNQSPFGALAGGLGLGLLQNARKV